MQVADVLIQAGHEGRTTGSIGTSSKWGAEIKWTPIIANETTRILREAGVSVIRKNAFIEDDRYQVKVAVYLHFDGSDTPCRTGASIGYHTDAHRPAATMWKTLYSQYWPFKWMPDNFTPDLRDYYGFRYTTASDCALVLEFGELTCEQQALWLRDNLKGIAYVLAHFISKRIGKGNVPQPGVVYDQQQPPQPPKQPVTPTPTPTPTPVTPPAPTPTPAPPADATPVLEPAPAAAPDATLDSVVDAIMGNTETPLPTDETPAADTPQEADPTPSEPSAPADATPAPEAPAS